MAVSDLFMLWLYLTFFAYLINAFSFVVDKYLLHASIPRPFGYAFGVSILSSFVIVLIPFGVTIPTLNYFMIAFASGAAFFGGLILLYKTIKESDISIASTKVGTFSVLFTYGLAVIFLGDAIDGKSVAAFSAFAAGIFFLAKTGKHILKIAVGAGILFAVSLVLMKTAFNLSGFIDGIFWTRIGFVLIGLSSLSIPKVRRDVKLSFSNSAGKDKSIFVINKIIATIGFLSLYYAIQLGKVSIVNGLLGFQFIFIFILALLFHKFIPGIKENIERKILLSKLAGIILISVGFILLV